MKKWVKLNRIPSFKYHCLLVYDLVETHIVVSDTGITTVMVWQIERENYKLNIYNHQILSKSHTY